MKCRNCNNEIREDSDFCPNCGKKIQESKPNKIKSLIIIIGIILVLCIIVALVIIIKNKNNINYKELNQTEITSQDNSYNESQPVLEEENFESPVISNVESEEIIDTTIMPNLVGMTYKEAMNYIENNGFYAITDIKCKYETTSQYGIKIPTKILSTIPNAGTKLDIYKENVITALADYNYGVISIEINTQDENFYDKYFGKNIKVQVGSDEKSFIEGVIGDTFFRKGQYDKSILKYTNKSKGKYVDLALENKIAYFDKNELVIESNIEHYINVKIWIDNELIKTTKFHYESGAIISGSL